MKVFKTLNNEQTVNMLQISKIEVKDTDVIYYPAKGSLDGIKEHFETEAEAEARYKELQDSLVV